MNPHPLSILAQVPADEIKAVAEDVLAHLEPDGNVQVLQNRTGIAMLPYTDSVQGTKFHLGEVMMAEAHVRLSPPSPLASLLARREVASDARGEVEGYGACLGRDLQQALALAILDAALRAGIEAEWLNAFIKAQAIKQQLANDALLRKVEATRVEMETF